MVNHDKPSTQVPQINRLLIPSVIAFPQSQGSGVCPVCLKAKQAAKNQNRVVDQGPGTPKGPRTPKGPF